MTISVLWFRERYNELWCAADSRISSSDSIITDSGPKIMPIPVTCFRHKREAKYIKTHNYTFGFTFAGSTLSANCTHSLATSCTQNLATSSSNPNPVSLEQVAKLYRQIGEDYIREISSRSTGSLPNLNSYVFEAFIFGFCPAKKKYLAFAIAPNITQDKFRMLLANVVIEPHSYHPLGSGANDFVTLNEELKKSRSVTGVIITLREMLQREKRTDVGGHFQIGVANKKGFELKPILRLNAESEEMGAKFLGFNIDSIQHFEDYRIGFQAFSPDVD